MTRQDEGRHRTADAVGSEEGTADILNTRMKVLTVLLVLDEGREGGSY